MRSREELLRLVGTTPPGHIVWMSKKEMELLNMASPTDLVNHPPHYTSHPSGVECIQITRHMNFNKGNALKYIWRSGEKGNEIQDLEKAMWYLSDEIKRLGGSR